MSLTINTRERDGVTILDLSGKITLGEATGKLRDTVRALVGEGKKKLVFNLSGLDYMDSAGLGELVGAYTTVANSGGSLGLLKVKGRALDLLQMTRLATLFQLFDDEDTAVGSLA